MSDTAISADTGEVASQETPAAVVQNAFEAEDVGVISDADAKEYFEDNSTLVPEVEEAPVADPEPEAEGEEVTGETEAEPEQEAEAEEADAEEEGEAEAEEAAEPELVEFTFGGKKLEVSKGDMTDELAGKVQQFTNEVWGDYTKKSQANAEVQKTLSAKSESVEKLMALNGEALQTYSVGLQLRNDIQQLQSVDMESLWSTNPDQARVYSDSLAQKQAEFQNIVSLVDQQETALNEAKQNHSVQRGVEGRKALNDKIQNFETEVAPKVVDYVMKEYGWDKATAERWDQNPDMTDMARKAMLYDQSQAKMKSASKKAAPKAKPVASMKAKGKGATTSDPSKMSMEQLSKHLKLKP